MDVTAYRTSKSMLLFQSTLRHTAYVNEPMNNGNVKANSLLGVLQSEWNKVWEAVFKETQDRVSTWDTSG